MHLTRSSITYLIAPSLATQLEIGSAGVAISGDAPGAQAESSALFPAGSWSPSRHDDLGLVSEAATVDPRPSCVPASAQLDPRVLPLLVRDQDVIDRGLDEAAGGVIRG